MAEFNPRRPTFGRSGSSGRRGIVPSNDGRTDLDKLRDRVARKSNEIREATGNTRDDDGGGLIGGFKDIAGGIADVAGSALGPVVDILSRGNFAAANTAQSIAQGESFGNILRAPVEGALGQEKTTFSDVFKTLGIGGAPGSVLGFAGDVLLDPLTYTGVGLAGKATKLTGSGAKAVRLAGRSAKAAKQSVPKEALERAAKEIGEETLEREGRQRAFQKLKAAGDDINDTKLMDKTILEEQSAMISSKAATLREEGLEQARRVLELRLTSPLGRKIYATRELPSVSKVLRRGKDALATREPARLLSKTFSTDALYGAGVQSVARTHALRNANDFDNLFGKFKSEARTMVRELTDAQQRTIAEALDTGATLADPQLETVRRWYKGALDEIGASERAVGLLRQERVPLRTGFKTDKEYKEAIKAWRETNEVVDNYFPYYFKGDEPKSLGKVNAARRQNGIAADGTHVPRKAFEGLDETPLTDLEAVMRQRLADHVYSMERYDFLADIGNKYGVALPTKPTEVLDKAREAAMKKDGWRTYRQLFADQEDKGRLHTFVGDLLAGDKDIWVDPEVARSLKEMDKVWGSDEVAAQWAKNWRKIHNAVKFNLTVINPGHHLRNMRGDIMNNFLDGVVNPNVYRKATQVLSAGDASRLSVKVGSDTLRGDEILDLWKQSGGRAGFIRTELGEQTRGIKKAGAGFVEAIRTGSEFREDIPRLAHFLDVLKRDGKGIAVRNANGTFTDEFMDVVRDAGERIRKFNIDYGDITPSEQKLKNVFPFYTWMRKNIPLQMEMLFTRPGVQAFYGKGINFLQEAYGEPDDSVIVPKWIRDASPGLVQLRGGQNPNAIGRLLQGLGDVPVPLVGDAIGGVIPGVGGFTGATGDDPTFLTTNTSIPLFDALETLNPLPALARGEFQEATERLFQDNIVDPLHPLIKVPIEVGTGRNLFIGNQQEAFDTFTGLAPLPQKLFSAALDPSEKNLQALINKLFATDSRVVTENRQKSELRRLEDRADQQRRRLGLIEER